MKDCNCIRVPFDYRDYESKQLGTDPAGGRYADVTLLTCRHCQSLWLCYAWEFEGLSHSGRWYRMAVDAATAGTVEVDGVWPMIQEADWYFYGGSYFGHTGRLFEKRSGQGPAGLRQAAPAKPVKKAVEGELSRPENSTGEEDENRQTSDQKTEELLVMMNSDRRYLAAFLDSLPVCIDDMMAALQAWIEKAAAANRPAEQLVYQMYDFCSDSKALFEGSCRLAAETFTRQATEVEKKRRIAMPPIYDISNIEMLVFAGLAERLAELAALEFEIGIDMFDAAAATTINEEKFTALNRQVDAAFERCLVVCDENRRLADLGATLRSFSEAVYSLDFSISAGEAIEAVKQGRTALRNNSLSSSEKTATASAASKKKAPEKTAPAKTTSKNAAAEKKISQRVIQQSTECYELPCSVCSKVAVRLSRSHDLFSKECIKYEGITFTRQIDLDQAPTIFSLLMNDDLAALHDLFFDRYHFDGGLDAYCPDCDLVYCRRHYSVREVFDEGYYDYSMGTCPEGHEREIDD